VPAWYSYILPSDRLLYVRVNGLPFCAVARCRLVYVCPLIKFFAKSGGSETSSSLSVSPDLPALDLCIGGYIPARRESGFGRRSFLAIRLNI
jgi:hypothetical protein